MNEENNCLSLPCYSVSSDSLDIYHHGGELLLVEITHHGVLEANVNITTENAIKLRDFLIEKLG
ncbi:hypothetical protein M5X00_26240 [Paenibacillus alvei]|uniref:hypothetical protein n=1 Tax=Paenibacillus alvei TaxID=44250 RepID=UPI000288CF9B|nr:hypothetical protein [Paenibacillus alvei]EJW14100.1 hypothetical protein PAV_141p02060 [Paenibacillus alvei DSM 29]MCY9545031.1 hypothetical protein [Paenibacillus alvei]MCY9707751.1 hypothetical protein [Paenibacillus alvei]MCY9757732.1 hypothetical protein [Paenibacillus alvei]MEC0082736.1 hypothetical protein [Paenibacillus alvei]